MAYTRDIDLDHGVLDSDSSGYYADGFHEEEPRSTFRRRIREHEHEELMAAIGIAS